MPLPTHYPSASKGPTEIASMQFDHAQRTVAKLIREDGDPKMIDAISAHIAAIEATFGDKVETL
jgi:hypothetical protein